MIAPSDASRPAMSRLVRFSIDGRATEEAVWAVADALRAALAEPGHFPVLFDRRAMTALTPGGRQALAELAERVLPELAGRCTAWADLFDERRAVALDRAGHHQDPPPPGRYPQRTFHDEQAALAWLANPEENLQ